jgi:starch phosphorylase
MAYLAVRGSGAVNGVSRLHGQVSRRIFAPLYARWPEHEVPVRHVTNGVHVPSWDSAWADRLWSEACGADRWRGGVTPLTEAVERISDEALWALRAAKSRDLVQYARNRLAQQLAHQGVGADAVAEARRVLDPNALTLGFARRMTEYKRPALLLRDPDRLVRLLRDAARPVQLIVAGKAHPADAPGKEIVRKWTAFVTDPGVRPHAIFLEDYDMALAQELVQGVDVWLNTPRRPWEACGTSGMKTLVNGGLNLSALDGWWDEAYAPDVGWALGGPSDEPDAQRDAREAEQLYRLLEEAVVPEFYDRDAAGLPRAWLARMRASMARLAPRFSGNRMIREYLETYYLPATDAVRRRCADGARLARALREWWTGLVERWPQVRFGPLEVREGAEGWRFELVVALGAIEPVHVRVELYAPPLDSSSPPECVEMERHERVASEGNGYRYAASVRTSRAVSDYTPRVLPFHPEARVPMEAGLILWQR